MAAPLAPDGRIRNRRFEEGVGKVVDYAPGFVDRTGTVKNDPDLQADLHTIIYGISRGERLPERFYRRGIDRGDDGLLEADGIKHLHLGQPGSDVLLFLIEFEEFVLLLEIDRHRNHFEPPAGEVLKKLHARGLAMAAVRAATDAAARIAKRTAIIKKGLLPRRRK